MKNDRIDKDNIRYFKTEKCKYDILIIATGCKIAPEEVPGMKGDTWQKIFSISTLSREVVLWLKIRNSSQEEN